MHKKGIDCSFNLDAKVEAKNEWTLKRQIEAIE